MVDRNEYKRRQAPPGVKITERAFGRDRRLPITNGYKPAAPAEGVRQAPRKSLARRKCHARALAQRERGVTRDDKDLTIRRLNARDYEDIAASRPSDYVYCRFDQRQLERIITSLRRRRLHRATRPAWPRYRRNVAWRYSHQSARVAQRLAGRLWRHQQRGAYNSPAHLAGWSPRSEPVRPTGAQHLYYSGGDIDNDWLAASLKERGFALVTLLRSYDKIGFYAPSHGEQDVRVRPFAPADLDGVLAVEGLAFDQLWRCDAPDFLDVGPTIPTSSSPKTRLAFSATSSTRWIRRPATSCVSRSIRARGTRRRHAATDRSGRYFAQLASRGSC